MHDNIGESLDNKRVATLISGGLDSAVLVAWAQEHGYDQLCLFVDYGQENLDRELACARINTQRCGAPLEVINLNALRGSFIGRFPFPLNLYDCSVKNPLGQVTTFGLTALAAGIGVLCDRFTLMLGVHHTDMELRPILRTSMTNLEEVVRTIVEGCTETSFNLWLPFQDKDREFVIKTGQELGVDFRNTWSCHADSDLPCGSCEGCNERSAAFSLAGIPDPQEGRAIAVPVKATMPVELGIP